MKNLFSCICLILCYFLIPNLVTAQTSDGICVPVTTVTPINQINPVPPNPIIACSSGIGLPTFGAPAGSLTDNEFVVEINGAIDVTNTTGSPAAALSNGDQICVSAFTYDLVAINSTLNSISFFCGFADCDALLGIPGAEQAISDLVIGVNDGMPGINDLEEVFTLAGTFGTPVTSVTQASAAIDGYNSGPLGATTGLICYASSAPICYTIDDGNVACTVLPVELIDFKSIAKDEGIQLLWQTASETNNEGFEIQLSSDFETWQMIDFVEGQGTTSDKQQYTYLDKTPNDGVNYYRLKQIDLDGRFEFSDIIKAERTSKIPNTSLVVFPNPVDHILNYQMANLADVQRVEIFGLNGQLIKRTERIEGALDIGGFKQGVYLLVITTRQNCLKQLIYKK